MGARVQKGNLSAWKSNLRHLGRVVQLEMSPELACDQGQFCFTGDRVRIDYVHKKPRAEVFAQVVLPTGHFRINNFFQGNAAHGLS